MQSRRVKISVSLPRDLVARIDRTARLEARSRSRVLESWLRATARESAARELEAATVEYYESGGSHGCCAAPRSDAWRSART